MHKLRDALLIVGATMRLTRFITQDDLGAMWVKDPIDRWMHSKPARLEAVDHRYLAGLECPHCVGTWVGFAVLATTLATRRTRLAGPWRFVMAGLTLNTVSVVAGDAVKYWD